MSGIEELAAGLQPGLADRPRGDGSSCSARACSSRRPPRSRPPRWSGWRRCWPWSRAGCRPWSPPRSATGSPAPRRCRRCCAAGGPPRGPAEQTFATLVGLELRPRKMREAAVLWERLTEAAGIDARDAVWQHPDLLPSLGGSRRPGRVHRPGDRRRHQRHRHRRGDRRVREGRRGRRVPATSPTGLWIAEPPRRARDATVAVVGRLYALDPAMPVLLRPDGAVQVGWDPRRAVLVRPPDGLTPAALAAVLRGDAGPDRT